MKDQVSLHYYINVVANFFPYNHNSVISEAFKNNGIYCYCLKNHGIFISSSFYFSLMKSEKCNVNYRTCKLFTIINIYSIIIIIKNNCI